MRQLRALFRRLAGTFTGGRADPDLETELQAHLDLETDEWIRRGLPPEEARRRARLSAGGVTQAAEAVRDQRGLPWLETIGADLRYALRTLRHAPVFTLVVVLTLALGIGATTAIFSVVRAVLLKPLPHRDGDRLVWLRHSADGPGRADLQFSVPEVNDLRAGVPALGGIAEYSPFEFTLHGADGAVRVNSGLVTGNYFEVMGLDPILGRVTGPADDGPGVPPVAVLTHGYWVKAFGADSGVVGRRLRVDGTGVTVIGVLQPAPYFPDPLDLFLNMVVSDHHLSAQMIQGRTHRMTQVAARLAAGATLEEVRAQVAAVYAGMQADHPDAYDANANYRVAVLPFREAIGDRARLTLRLLMGAAALVMLIAAASVANLTMMRGVRRTQELVVRAALGAGTARLRRLLLAENLVLSLGGAGLGLLVASGGVRLLTSFAARYSPRAAEIHLDGMVLGFAAAMAVGLAVALSRLAALPREGTFASWIAAGLRRMTSGLGRHRLQRGLVVAQVAVSVMLLAGAGLLTRTMLRLSQVETGLATEEILTVQVPVLQLSQVFVPGADAGAKAAYDRMAREVRALPGVVEVGLGSVMPLRSSSLRLEVKAEGKALGAGESFPNAEVRTASPEYFRAAGVPILVGRAFQGTDGPEAGRVVIINRTLADRYFPNEDPVGKRIAYTGQILKFTPLTDEWRTIVGVAANTQDGGLDAPPRPVVFMPFAQMITIGGGLVIRVERDAATLVPQVTRIIRAVAPEAPIERMMTVSQIKDQSVSPRRLNAALVSSFGVLALIIAMVGIAGVLAFSVSARTTEIGIRMSLGADRGRVQRMILREGGGLLGAGLVLGVAGAFFATRAIRGLLFGVAPHDPVTYASVALVMMAIGLAACWIPALRAARVDPAITLRA